MSADTTAEAEAVQFELIRRLSPEDRLRRGLALCVMARKLQRAGIRKRHPEYSDDDVQSAWLRLSLADDDLFRAAWPERPLLEP